MKIVVLIFILIGIALGAAWALRSGKDVHWDLRTSHLDKDIGWPAHNASDTCAYERGAIHTAVIDLPGLPQIRTTPLLFVDCRRNGNAVYELDLCQAAVTRDDVVAQARALEQLFHWAKNPIEDWVNSEEKHFGSGGLLPIQREDWFRNERPLEVWGTIVNNSNAESPKPYSLMIEIWWRSDDPSSVGVRNPSQADAGLRALQALARQHPQTTKPATVPSVPFGSSP